MADYTNYARAAIYSVEQVLRRDWKFIWAAGHPMLRILNYKGNNFNKGFGIAGPKMLLPIGIADQANPADGVQVSAETTPMTANTLAGTFMLEYQFAHYRTNYVVRESDKRIVGSNSERSNYLEFLKKQALESVRNVVSSDVVVPTTIPTGTNSADATDAIQSLRYIIAAANVVGGKDQALDSNWQSVLRTSVGPFLTDYVDIDMDLISAKDRSQVDFLLAANKSGGYVYQSFKSALAPGERWVNTDFSRKAGLKNFVYNDATVLQDNRNDAGDLLGISSDTFYVFMPDAPTFHEPQRIGLTDAYETVLSYWCALGCDDVGCNFRHSSVT